MTAALDRLPRWTTATPGRRAASRPGFARRVANGELREELRQNLAWLIELRWIAVVGVGAALLIGYWTGWVPDPFPPLVVAAVLAGANLGFWLRLRRVAAVATAHRLHWALVLHLHVDLVALSLLVRWTGGIHNPFALFCVFPVALGAILLPTRTAVLTGLSAYALFAGLVMCEVASHVPYHLALVEPAAGGDLLEHPVYIGAVLIALAMTLFGVVYFVHSLVVQHRRAETRRRQHERIARSRRRLARVGQIAAGVAHSIRNPLHGVLNCLELVREECGARALQPLALLGEGLERIKGVTARLLALTRESPIAREPVDLNDLIDETLRLLEARFREHDIELCRDLGRLPTVPVDPLRFQETLFNVLDNSIAAVREAPVRRIEIRTWLQSEPVDTACVEVTDTGEGVEVADLEHVFDPFFSTKPVGEGSGLGLAIAQEVLEAHGGEIRFQSSRGVGTSVRMSLPVDPREVGGAEERSG